MLLNVLNKPTEVVARAESKVLLVPTISLPEEVQAEAERQANVLKTPTDCPTVTVEQCLQLPAGTVFNIVCKVTELKEINRVTTQYKSVVDVRNGEFGDATGSLCFAFWRQLAHFPLEVGQVVKVRCAVLSQTTQGLPKVTGGRHTQLEIMPNDTIKEVKGFENKFQEEGELIGFTAINVFHSCSNPLCYHKKLVNNECPTCHKQHSSDNIATEDLSHRSAVCSIMVDTGKETPEEITLFDSHIKQLLQTPEIPQ